jgi:hypothetical protein
MQNQSAAAFLAFIVSEKGMAKSRRRTVLDPVWLKCSKGVAGAPQPSTFN